MTTRTKYGVADFPWPYLVTTSLETSSKARQGRARFQQHRDASCHQFFFFPARQGAEGNSRHSDRNSSLIVVINQLNAQIIVL